MRKKSLIENKMKSVFKIESLGQNLNIIPKNRVLDGESHVLEPISQSTYEQKEAQKMKKVEGIKEKISKKGKI